MSGISKSTLIIVHDLEHSPVGVEFSQWPLHITLAFYFSFDSAREVEIINGISGVTRGFGSIVANPGQVAMFGSNKDVAVTEINDVDGKIAKLHRLLIDKLSELSCDFTDSTYSFDDFRPHVSDQFSRRCPQEPFAIRSISIIKKLSGTPTWNKVVLKQISL